MADPLSITASIITVAQLAGELLELGHTYPGGVKEAPKGLRELADGLQPLGNVLITLRDCVQADENLDSTALQLINGQTGPSQGVRWSLGGLSQSWSQSKV